MKLPETLTLAAAVGLLILWIAEYQRTTFADSYWLLMLCLSFLLLFQFIRNRRIERDKEVSPTIKQMAADRQKKKKK
jgi:Flp pilus assembly protein TadB